MPATFDVKTQGVDHLIDRLKGFEPEVYKILQREIKAAADKVGSSARGMVPTWAIDSTTGAGWGPWEQGRLDFFGPSVAASIKPSFRSRRIGGQRYVMGLVTSRSAPLAVYALAGSKSSGPFSDAIASAWGENYPRAMGPAWTFNVDKARDDIQSAINKAAEKVT